MTKYKEVELDPWTEETLPAAKKAQLLQNIEVCRDAVVFFTACGSASGYGGTRACMYVTRKQQGPFLKKSFVTILREASVSHACTGVSVSTVSQMSSCT